MALVCDVKSDESAERPTPELGEDLEDGEIEDDDEAIEEPQVEEAAESAIAPPSASVAQNVTPPKFPSPPEKPDKERSKEKSEKKRDRRHKNKEPRHMTEAERSILHLRRKERMEREKWSKYRKDQTVETQDDFAINLEKTLASILKKDRGTSDEDKEDERRSSKRKKRGRDNERKAKQRKIESPRSEEMDENEMMRSSPDLVRPDKNERLKSPRSELSYESENSTDHEERAHKSRRESRRENKKNNKNKNKNRDRNFKRDRSRDRQQEPQTEGVCIFYLNGKCNKSDCIYSHEAVPPMKLELCKFYLMDCCAKGENCSYMHSEFPCKFYHMGIPCNMGDNCKFAHGKPLTDGLKQILFKHIETAPRDILGGFPRLSREDMLNMMENRQKNLIDFYQKTAKKSDKSEKSDETSGDGSSLFDFDVPPLPMDVKNSPSDNKTKSTEKTVRNRPSRWQEPDPADLVCNLGMNFVPFNFSQDQDMRISSNGDVDMRTLPPHPLSSIPQPLPCLLPMGQETTQTEVAHVQNPTKDVDIRNMPPSTINFASDVDLAQKIPETNAFLGPQDVDIRFTAMRNEDSSSEPSNDKSDLASTLNIPSSLPKIQRELYMRIQAQQRDNLIVDEESKSCESTMEPPDISWYSDDDDDDDENRLTIKVDNEECAAGRDKDEEEEEEDKTEENEPMSAPIYNSFKPSEVVEKLGDLSKIKITADITKLLSSLSANLPNIAPLESTTDEPGRSEQEPHLDLEPEPEEPTTPKASRIDPRTRVGSTDARDPRKPAAATSKSEKLSIYEQGGIDLGDLDLRIETGEDYKGSIRPDVDLRTLGLPFKGMENYTPATEIDARISSHPPITWNVVEIDIPRPDYTGLKLSISDAEKTGDPRLRKIFRLSVEEKDTPTSPVTSPRTSTVRIDPRLRKVDEIKPMFGENPAMNYNQQLNTLQSSVFYQSLTSNQKLMLNQELASRADQSGSHDPLLNGILANLNLIPPMGQPTNQVQNQGTNFGMALNILQTINKMNQPMTQNGMIVPNVNPNMMGPNMMNQMVQPGLLGAAPGVPNMQHEFPMNFDPRTQGGLLGTGPQGILGNGPQFPTFEPPGMQGPGFQNYQNDDFYPQENNQGFRGNQMRNDRSGNFNNRERRRGGRNFRNQGNRNQFRRNGGGGRSIRAHTPP